MVVAIFRYRTAEGLVLLLPESADVLVGTWTDRFVMKADAASRLA